MSDGCWVQFWDDKNCAGATLRFDEDTGTGARLVANLDDYVQSDGSKEGNEADSLVTGSRTWLMVYKDKDFDGSYASFGPNTRIDDLGDYGFGGNISSFKMYDYKPTAFVETAAGSPVAYESSNGAVDAATVNNFFRTVVGAAATFIPGIGSGLSILIRGLWPDVNNKDQLWGSFQNYLNQAIAGVYWQTTYAYLNAELEALFNAAKAFVETPDVDHQDKADRFKNLLDLVNNDVPFFIDENAPWTRFSFLTPFATLRLATLRENLENYAYYYGSEPSTERKAQLTKELQDDIALYQSLLVKARTEILARRDQMIYVDDDVLIDIYTGSRISIVMTNFDARRGYAEGVLNALALKLDLHIATSQIWPHFDPDVKSPVLPPVLTYASGPKGYYWYGNSDFTQMANNGRITGATLWTIDGTSNPAYQNGLELDVDGVGEGRAGGTGGDPATLDLEPGEVFVDVNGSAELYFLQFVSSTGETVSAGDPVRKSVFHLTLLPELVNGRLTGITGSAGGYQGNPALDPCVRVITAHWQGELPLDTAEAPRWAWAAAPEPAEAI